MLGLEHVPGAVAISKWLRRMGAIEGIQEALDEVNWVLLATSLRRCKAVTLDIDVTEVDKGAWQPLLDQEGKPADQETFSWRPLYR